MSRRAMVLTVAALTASLAVGQAQDQKASTDSVFYKPGWTPNQEQQRFETGAWQSEQAAWERSVQAIGNNNTPDPLGDEDAVSATSLAAPKEAKAALRKALRELDKVHSAKPAKSAEHLNMAKGHLEEAVAQYPEYAAAWTKLGQVKASLGDPNGAIVALEKSLELDGRYLPPYDALVWLYMAKGDWGHAIELTELALDINPAYTKMRWYQAGCAYETGRDDEALSLFREIQDHAEAARFPQTHLFLGRIYARKGQFAKAAADYRLYLKSVPNAPDAAAIEKQLDEWQQLGVI